MRNASSSAHGAARLFALVDLVAVAAAGFLAVSAAARPRAAVSRPSGTRDHREGLDVHNARAAERGRGRQSAAPWNIPFAGWKDIFWRVYNQITEDRLLAVAAGVVFYGLLAIFPTVTAFVSIYGLFADASTVQSHVALLSNFAPPEVVGPIQEQIYRVATTRSVDLSFAFIFSVLLALWSSNAGMKAVIDALNVAYDETERRSFVKLTLISLAMTVGAIFAALVGVGAVVVFPIVLSYLGIESAGETIVSILRWPVLLAALLLGLAVLYRFGPNRTTPRWEWLSVGSVFAAVAWIVGSFLFSYYLSRFANYNATYGSLAAGIGLMMWLWLSAIIVLLGAELNAEIEHQTARDTTVGPDRQLGRRGAIVADTVGEAQT